MLVANARMYTVEPATDAAWRAWMTWVASAAAVPLRYEPHPAPASLHALWERPDLGCALMCGYPLAVWPESATRPHVLAAPIPSMAEPPGSAVYRTAIVTRADAAPTSVDDLRGKRFAYTTPGSQSGYQAVRAWIAERAVGAGGRWFGTMVGPLVTPRGVVDALVHGDADAGPLDAYWLELLRLHEPRTAQQLRVVAWTPWTPVPPFVCSAALPPAIRAQITTALLASCRTPDLASVRTALALAGVAPASATDYTLLARRAEAVDALGYASLH